MSSKFEKPKYIGIGISIGFVLGAIVTMVMTKVFGAKVEGINIGGIDYGLPTVAITSQPLPTKIFTGITPIATKFSEKDGMVLVYVPKGEFFMGSDSGNPDEHPAHLVYLDAFWIDQTEITNRMYALCVASGVCTPPSKSSSTTRENYYNNFAYENYPVTYISWVQASTYCDWAARRLPTEAEWEKAARGTDGRRYPWGNDDPQENLLNFDRLIGDTTDVYKYTLGTSPYGVYDMAGNVYECVSDYYDANYYSNKVYNNPTGPESTTLNDKVVRGGSWLDRDNYTRSSTRSRLWFNNVDDPAIGFRCVLPEK